MARPRKPVRYVENGGSLKVWDDLGYAGSISMRDLAFFLRSKRLSPTDVYKETPVSDDKVQ